MARAENADLIDDFEDFYHNYYHNEIVELAQKYPNEQRSLFINLDDLYRFDSDLADDYRSHPDQLQEYAEEALRLYDLPIDVSLGRAHVRIHGLTETTEIREIRARHRGQLLSVQGIIRKATGIQNKITEAAFECQRCGTLTRIPQTGSDFLKPHECQGCERKGPFNINFDQSEFVDSQTIQVRDDPVNLSKGVSSENIKIEIEDDITEKATVGSRVRVCGVLHLNQEDRNGSPDPTFGQYIDGISIESLGRESPAREQSQPIQIIDLDSYTERATTAIATLPRDAREEETKAKLITPFIEALGWNKYDSREVRLEYTDEKTTLYPDYALFGPESETPDVIIEAKQLSTDLDKNKIEQQLQNYLRVFAAQWGVLSNGREFYVYQHRGDDSLPAKLAEIRFKDLTQAEVLDSLQRNAFYD